MKNTLLVLSLYSISSSLIQKVWFLLTTLTAYGLFPCCMKSFCCWYLKSVTFSVSHICQTEREGWSDLLCVIEGKRHAFHSQRLYDHRHARVTQESYKLAITACIVLLMFRPQLSLNSGNVFIGHLHTMMMVYDRVWVHLNRRFPEVVPDWWCPFMWHLHRGYKQDRDIYGGWQRMSLPRNETEREVEGRKWKGKWKWTWVHRAGLEEHRGWKKLK